jgi:uncharacterized protein YecT (DUF1311 family)
MSNKEKYYEYKVKEIEKAREERRATELNNYGLIALAALICALAILFIISPGLMVTMLAIKATSFRSSTPVLWGIAAFQSVIIFCLIYFAVKNIKKTLLIYFVMCVLSVLASIYIKDNNSQNFLESVFDKYFWVTQVEKSVAIDQSKKIDNNASTTSASQSAIGDIKNNPTISAPQSSSLAQETMPKSEGKEAAKSENEINAKSTGPSFNCKGRLLKVEEVVCSDEELSRLDVELNNLYQSELQQAKDKRQIKSEQLDWIVHSMRMCTERDCLINAYQTRIDALKSL